MKNSLLRENGFLPLLIAYSAPFLNQSLVTVAVPDLAKAFEASASELLWVVNLSAGVGGVLMLVFGPLADQLQTKRLFVVGSLILSSATLLSIGAWSLPVLMSARALTGVGSAMILPSAYSLAMKIASREQTAHAVALLSTASTAGFVLGPVLSAMIITTLSWRGSFFPVVICMAISLLMLPKGEHPKEESNQSIRTALSTFDWKGVFLLFCLSGLSLFTLERLLSFDWWAAALTAGLLTTNYLAIKAHFRSSLTPVISLSVLRNPGFLWPVAMIVLTQMVYSAYLYLTPILLQLTQGVSSFNIGILLFAVTSTGVFISLKTSELGQRVGKKILIRRSLHVTILTLCLLSLSVAFPPKAGFILLFTLISLLISFVSPINILMISNLIRSFPESRSSTASAILAFVIRYGYLFGTIIASHISHTIYQNKLQGLTNSLSTDQKTKLLRSLGSAVSESAGLGAAGQGNLVAMAKSAFSMGYATSLLGIAIIVGVVSLIYRYIGSENTKEILEPEG